MTTTHMLLIGLVLLGMFQFIRLSILSHRVSKLMELKDTLDEMTDKMVMEELQREKSKEELSGRKQTTRTMHGD